MDKILITISFKCYSWVKRKEKSANLGGGRRYTQLKDEETRWTAFELRMYDGRKARWDAPDLFRQYHTPYLAMGNNPMRFIDPTGGYSEIGLTEQDKEMGLFSVDKKRSEERFYNEIEREKAMYLDGNITGSAFETITLTRKVRELLSGNASDKAWRVHTVEYIEFKRKRASTKDKRFGGLEESSSQFEWPTWTHNDILDEAFRDILPSDVIAILKQASYDLDRFQEPAYSYMHAMRAPGQTTNEAKKEMLNFIKSAQTGFVENEGILSWYALGMALHPLMDATSSAHEGFQVWHGLEGKSNKVKGARHFADEMFPVLQNLPVFPEDNKKFEQAVKLVRGFYYKSLQQKQQK